MTTPLRHTPLLPGTLQNLLYPPEQYEYFARAHEVPFAGAGPVAKAAWAADAAMLAYARYGARRMTDAELDGNFGPAGLVYEKIGGSSADWNASGTQAVFASCDDFAMCAFRGTEQDDPRDVVWDLDIVLVPEHDYGAAAEPAHTPEHLNLIGRIFGEPCLVHQGFQIALGQVWEQIRDCVAAYRASHPGKEIFFTGHSLGAAIALLAFSRLDDPDISLFTFGCPRVGNGTFRDRVLSHTGRGIYRVVNYNDAITHIPPDSMLYRQTPTECYRFAQDGDLNIEDDSSFKADVVALRAALAGLPASLRLGNLKDAPAPPSLIDHSPARYCFRLWDCV